MSNPNAWMRYKNAPNAILDSLKVNNLEKLINNSYMSSNRTGLANWQRKALVALGRKRRNQNAAEKWRRTHPISSRARNVAGAALKGVAMVGRGGLSIAYTPKNKTVRVTNKPTANLRRAQMNVKNSINALFKTHFLNRKVKLPQRYINFNKSWTAANNNLKTRQQLIEKFNISQQSIFQELPYTQKLEMLALIAMGMGAVKPRLP